LLFLGFFSIFLGILVTLSIILELVSLAGQRNLPVLRRVGIIWNPNVHARIYIRFGFNLLLLIKKNIKETLKYLVSKILYSSTYHINSG
jgi:hypothetical protein